MKHDRRHLGLRGLPPIPVIMEGDRDEVGPSTAPAFSSQQQALGTANSPIMLIPAGSLVCSFGLRPRPRLVPLALLWQMLQRHRSESTSTRKMAISHGSRLDRLLPSPGSRLSPRTMERLRPIARWTVREVWTAQATGSGHVNSLTA